MKKLTYLLLISLLLVACSKEKLTPVSSQPDQTEQSESTGTDLGLAKDRHKEYDYETLLGDEVADSTLIKYNGIVTLSNPEWFVLVEVVDGTETHPVKVFDYNIGDKVEIIDGKELTVYGTYEGKDDNGAPTIKAFIIEE